MKRKDAKAQRRRGEQGKDFTTENEISRLVLDAAIEARRTLEVPRELKGVKSGIRLLENRL